MPRNRSVSWLPSVWGRKAIQGALVWEGDQPWLHTPSGPILLAIPADAEIPLVPFAPAGPAGHGPGVRQEVIVVGKRSHQGGRLVLVVRYLTGLARQGASAIGIPPEGVSH